MLCCNYGVFAFCQCKYSKIAKVLQNIDQELPIKMFTELNKGHEINVNTNIGGNLIANVYFLHITILMGYVKTCRLISLETVAIKLYK